MVRRDVFARVPGEGRRGHVLVADGNVGIGGDPAMLLARAAPLLSVGTRLVEIDPAPERDWRGTVRVRTAAGPAHRQGGRGGGAATLR